MKLLSDHKTQLKSLLGLVLVGSILGIENSQAYGCLFDLQLLSVGNLIFLFISFGLLFSAIKTKDSNFAFKLVLIETIIWIAKYILYKGGYVTGFSASANPVNVIYDFVSIAFRFFILFTLSKKIKLKITASIIASVIIVALKINLFATPWFTKKMWDYREKQTQTQRTELVGVYRGTIQQLSSAQTAEVNIRINSTSLIIKGSPPFKLYNEYKFNLDYPNHGSIKVNQLQASRKPDTEAMPTIVLDVNEQDLLTMENKERQEALETGMTREKESSRFDILIERHTQDSLVLFFSDMFDIKYEIKLKSKS